MTFTSWRCSVLLFLNELWWGNEKSIFITMSNARDYRARYQMVFPLFLCWECVYIYHQHHVALVARISLTLSRHSSLSFIALGRSSGQHPVSSHSCWMYVRAGHVWGSIRVHLLWVRHCFSSSVLHVWYIYIYIHAHTHRYIYIYTHMHIYIYIYT